MGVNASGPTPMIWSALLTQRDRVVHGFTTRAVDLAGRSDRDEADLIEHWESALAGLSAGLDVRNVAILHQVHEATVVQVREARGPLAPVAVSDAAFTDVSGLVLAVRVADCVPVLIAGERTVAVVHSGWRGTAVDIAGATVRALIAYGERPERLVAAIGPCISGAAYEVGEEVVQGLLASGLGLEDFVVSGFDAPHVDLGAAVRAQLERVGVIEVERVGGCTFTDRDLWSYRRDGGRAGRLAGLIARTEP